MEYSNPRPDEALGGLKMWALVNLLHRGLNATQSIVPLKPRRCFAKRWWPAVAVAALTSYF